MLHGELIHVVSKLCVIVLKVLLLRPGRGAEYFVISASVCVCLSVFPRAYHWNRWTDRHEILCADPLWPWLGPPPAALRYVMYFRLCG